MIEFIKRFLRISNSNQNHNGNNYSVNYSIIECKPFVINSDINKNGKFNYMKIQGENIEIVNTSIAKINKVIKPLSNFIENKKLSCNYRMENIEQFNEYPSQIRIGLTTETGKKAKYPTSLFLSYWDNYYGSKGLCTIDFFENGEIGKCEISFNMKDYTYNISIRIKDGMLVVTKIMKALSVSPYTRTNVYMNNN